MTQQRTTDIPTPDDDTAGHVLHGEAAQNPVTGGRAPDAHARTAEAGFRAAVGEQDDTEGHMKTRLARAADAPPDDDDTEGHMKTRLARAADAPPDDDDTEGHMKTR